MCEEKNVLTEEQYNKIVNDTAKAVTKAINEIITKNYQSLDVPIPSKAREEDLNVDEITRRKGGEVTRASTIGAIMSVGILAAATETNLATAVANFIEDYEAAREQVVQEKVALQLGSIFSAIGDTSKVEGEEIKAEA